MTLARVRPRTVERVRRRRFAHVEDPPAGGGGGGGPLIYAAVTAADVSTYLQTLLASAATFVPVAGWTCDEEAGNLVDFVGALELVASGPATTTVSAHGRAAEIVDDTAGWKLASAVPLEVGLDPFAWLVRATFDAAPAIKGAFLSRSATASPHYQLFADELGQFGIQAKQMGGPTTARIVANACDGVARWYLGGRSITREQLEVYSAVGAPVAAAFAASINLTTFPSGVPFGLVDPAFPQTGAGVTGRIDHVLGWIGADAENVLTAGVALVAALEAAEA